MSIVGVGSAVAALNSLIQSDPPINLTIYLSDRDGEPIADLNIDSDALAGAFDFYPENLVQTDMDRTLVTEWLTDIDTAESVAITFEIGSFRANLTRTHSY